MFFPLLGLVPSHVILLHHWDLVQVHDNVIFKKHPLHNYYPNSLCSEWNYLVQTRDQSQGNTQLCYPQTTWAVTSSLYQSATRAHAKERTSDCCLSQWVWEGGGCTEVQLHWRNEQRTREKVSPWCCEVPPLRCSPSLVYTQVHCVQCFAGRTLHQESWVTSRKQSNSRSKSCRERFLTHLESKSWS